MPKKNKNEYCIFILSHKRADNIITLKTLSSLNCTNDIYIIVDDTDPQKESYIEKFGKKVIVFDKLLAWEKTDTMDNFKKLNAVVYARNECFDIAKSLGYEYFLVLDDDYTAFNTLYDENLRFKRNKAYNITKFFDIIFTFYKNTPAIKTIALAQGGDLIGGEGSNLLKRIWLKRKAMNSFFLSTERRFDFKGSINEDVNAYVLNQQFGDIFFTTNLIYLNQMITQSNKGGLTDIYLTLGTYVKSFYSIIANPASVKINLMGNKNKRLHHIVNYRNTAPCILSQTLKRV
jgi:hypothetical protein